MTFKPDLARFKMEELEDDIISIMARRAVDMAGILRNVSVTLNGEKLPVGLSYNWLAFLLIFLVEKFLQLTMIRTCLLRRSVRVSAPYTQVTRLRHFLSSEALLAARTD